MRIIVDGCAISLLLELYSARYQSIWTCKYDSDYRK